MKYLEFDYSSKKKTGNYEILEKLRTSIINKKNLELKRS